MTATKFKYRLDRRSRRITWGTFAAIAALLRIRSKSQEQDSANGIGKIVR